MILWYALDLIFTILIQYNIYIRSGYWSGNRTPIPVAIWSGNWSRARHAQTASANQIHAFTSCVLSLSIEGIRLLNRIHLRDWGLELTLTDVFFVALGTRARGVRNKIALVWKSISASNCISGKWPFFRSLSSPCNTKPHHCPAPTRCTA